MSSGSRAATCGQTDGRLKSVKQPNDVTSQTTVIFIVFVVQPSYLAQLPSVTTLNHVNAKIEER